MTGIATEHYPLPGGTKGFAGYIPTNKWIVARLTALGTLGVLVAEHGWHVSATTLLIGIVVQAAVSYFTPNSDTPGGVPDAT